MSEVERIARTSAAARDEFRREVIARIGAWSLDHPRQRPDYERIFPRPIAELRESFFEERKKQVRKINEDLLVLLTDGADEDAARRGRRRADDARHDEERASATATTARATPCWP